VARRVSAGLLLNVVAMTVAAVAAVSLLNAGAFREFHLASAAAELSREARLLEQPVAALLGNPDALRELCRETTRDTGIRLTVIGPDGVVLADSDADAGTMDNHAQRPEVSAALSGRPATAIRDSYTVRQTLVYTAIPVERDGRTVAVLRTSTAVGPAHAALGPLWARSAVVGIVVAALAALLLVRATRSITRPILKLAEAARAISAGELDRRVAIHAPAELSDLAQSFNAMAAELESRIATVLRQHSLVEAMFAGMPDGILAIDRQGAIIDLNEAAATFIGTPRADALGRDAAAAVRNREILGFVRQAQALARPLEEELTLYGEREQHLQVRGSSFGGADGAVAGLLVIIHDVTRMRRLETLRQDFAANVSHELKTPVTSIKGFVETLQDGAVSDPASAARFLQIIAKEADRLAAIIEDLMSLARLDQHEQRHDIELVQVRIRPVLDAAIDACGALARARLVNVTIECPGDVVARADAALLERAVTNLVDNAIKYSPEGAEVAVRAGRDVLGLAIVVQDSGCGIAAEHVPRIFERFYRVDRARSRAQGGTGLGLAIVKHVAQALGGSVAVESAVGKGSTFAIRLP
jgi:two-component system, OmpR family, phosphate regulon sensor histidine kinase PhoR